MLAAVVEEVPVRSRRPTRSLRRPHAPIYLAGARLTARLTQEGLRIERDAATQKAAALASLCDSLRRQVSSLQDELSSIRGEASRDEALLSMDLVNQQVEAIEREIEATSPGYRHRRQQEEEAEAH